MSKRILMLGVMLAVASAVHAADRIKANNTNPLNDPASWSGGVVPTSSDVGVWDATVTTANIVALGADTNWSGVRIANPGGPVTITGATALTLGSSGLAGGVDLSAATQDLTMSNNLTLGSVQNWSVANGRTLRIEGALGRNAGSAVRFNLDESLASVFVPGNPNTLLTNGNIVFGTVGVLDYAGRDGANKIVSGETLGLYISNPGGGTPNLDNANAIVDFLDTTSTGFRLSTSPRQIWGVRINQPHPANAQWQMDLPSGRTLRLNSILITPNVDTDNVIFSNSGFVQIPNNATQDLLIYQNNPFGSLLFNNTGGIAQQGGAGILTKMGVGRVEIPVNATHAGGTRIYEGSVRVSGNGKVGTGALNVYGGQFIGASGAIIQPSQTTIFNGATNIVEVNAANGRFTATNSLVLNSGATWLEFNYAAGVGLSATTAPLLLESNQVSLVAGSLVNNGTANISVKSGSLPVGQYPLIQYTGTNLNTGSYNLFAYLPHTTASLVDNSANKSIDLLVTVNNQPLTWAAGSATWDINATANWEDATTASTTYQQAGVIGDNVIFEDSQSGSSPITVTLNSTVTPVSVTVNATKDYTIAGSGSIGGSGSFTKTNSGTLTLSTANSFTGGINLDGGTVIFSSLTNLGGGAIGFNGSTLQYASGNVDDISVRTVRFNADGATIDDNGQTITFANPVGNIGAGGFTKAGSGTLTLSGNNRYAGTTRIPTGTLALAVGAAISNSAGIVLSGGANLDVQNLPSIILSTPVAQILSGSGTILGGLTVPAATTVTPGTNGVVGTLTLSAVPSDLVVNGGTLIYDVSTSSSDLITLGGNVTLGGGTVQLIVSGVLTNGVYTLIQYGGALVSGSGSSANLTVVGFSQAGQSAFLSDATPGQIDLVVGPSASDVITWRGTGTTWDLNNALDWLNVATPWAYTNGDFVTFDDTGLANPTVTLGLSLQPSTVTVNNSAGDYTFQGLGKISGTASVTKSGSATLNIVTANNYVGPTTINAGTVILGDGFTTGTLGGGNITNNGTLIGRQPDDRTILGRVSGSGSLDQQGSAVLTLAQDSTYTGATTITSGALQFGTNGAGGNAVSSPINNNSILIINRSGAFTLTNSVTGSGGLVKQGSGTMTIARTNTYTSFTSVSNGMLRLGAVDAVPDAVTVPGSTGPLLLDGGPAAAGIFDLNGFNESVNSLQGLTGTVLGRVTNSVAAATSATNTITILNTTDTTYSGLIQDAQNATRARIAVLKLGGGAQILSGANTYSGGTIVGAGRLGLGTGGQSGNTAAGIGSITMSNGTTINLGGNNITFVANPVIIAPNSTATFDADNLSDQFTGTVTGDSVSTNAIIRQFSSGAAGQWNTFPGTVVVTAGMEMRHVGANGGGTNTTFQVDGTLHTRDAANFFIGALTGSGVINQPTVAAPATFVIGSKNVDSAFTGTIEGFNNIVKNGTGTLTLNSNFLHTGFTTVSNGTLALIAPAMPANSPTITVVTAATLDARDIGYISNYIDEINLITNTFVIVNHTLLVGTTNVAQTLAGGGTVLGNVDAGTNSTVLPGSDVGPLTVSSNLALRGLIVMELNRTNAPATNDALFAQSYTVSGATLNVSNVGPDLVTGDAYRLFSGGVSGFTVVNLPVSNANNTIEYQWDNDLATDGTITVLFGAPPVSTVPTNLTFSVSGNQLTLTWPASHKGWRLQSQTNSISSGLGTNWFTVPNSAATNEVIVTVDPAQPTVFYRLIYP